MLLELLDNLREHLQSEVSLIAFVTCQKSQSVKLVQIKLVVLLKTVFLRHDQVPLELRK